MLLNQLFEKYRNVNGYSKTKFSFTPDKKDMRMH